MSLVFETADSEKECMEGNTRAAARNRIGAWRKIRSVPLTQDPLGKTSPGDAYLQGRAYGGGHKKKKGLGEGRLRAHHQGHVVEHLLQQLSPDAREETNASISSAVLTQRGRTY